MSSVTQAFLLSLICFAPDSNFCLLIWFFLSCLFLLVSAAERVGTSSFVVWFVVGHVFRLEDEDSVSLLDELLHLIVVHLHVCLSLLEELLFEPVSLRFFFFGGVVDFCSEEHTVLHVIQHLVFCGMGSMGLVCFFVEDLVVRGDRRGVSFEGFSFFFLDDLLHLLEDLFVF